MAALFRAEQVARAANFQVAHGDFEAAAERGVLLHGADAFAHVGQQPRVARQQQIRVGLVLVAAHAPAQLIKIAQAEPVRAIDDDGVRVRNIEAALDDRGGKQHVRLAVHELRHHFFQFVRCASGRGRRRCGRGARATAKLLLPSSRIVITRLCRKNTCPPRFISRWMASRISRSSYCGDDGLDRQPVVRRRLDGAHVARAGEREVKRARNRRGAEREHVHQRAQAA